MTESEHRAWVSAKGVARMALASLRLIERVSAETSGEAHLDPRERWPDELAPPVAATIHIGEARRIPVVVRASVRAIAGDRLELVDPALPLALRASHRRFRDATVREIVDAVLAEVELSAHWRLAETPARLPYVVQSGETDLAFVQRLLAAHGAHYFVDDDGALTVSDSSRDARSVRQAPLELIHTAEALVDEPGVLELYRGARVAPGRVTVADYDWKHPAVALTASSDAARDVNLERYLWPAGFRDPSAGERLAQQRLEAERALADYAEGRATVAELGPGRRFTLLAEEDAREDWFVVEVEHRIDAGVGYQNRFLAIPRAAPYRPAYAPPPAVSGLESAMARGPAGADIHTDPHGRFKAEMPWDADALGTDEGARWVRLLQECSSGMFLARSGWEMLLAYVDGDPARPVGIGRAMHAGMPPSYAQPAFQSAMTVRTRSSPQDSGGGSELCISDDRGGQRIELVAQRDIETLVKRNQSVRIGRDASEKVGSERTLAVRGDRVVEVNGNLSRHVHGEAREAVEGSLRREVGAGESVSIKRARKETVSGNDQESVSSVRITIDGGVGSPADIVRNMVPDPRQAIAGVLATTVGQLTGGVSQIAQAATAPLAAARGMVDGVAAPPKGIEGILATGASLEAIPGQLGDLRGSVTRLGQLPSMIGALPGSIPSLGQVFGAARAQLAGTLRAAIPSLSTLAGALAIGEISKKSDGRISRRVGGAFVSVSLGDISEKALLAHAEMVGGVRLKLTPHTVKTSVGGPLTLIVGGTLLRASRSISLKSLHASFTAGAAIRIKADGPLTIRGDQIMLRGRTSLKITAGETAAVTMSRSALSIERDLSTKAPVVELKGDAVNVTKG